MKNNKKITTVDDIDFSEMLPFVQTFKGLAYNEAKPVIKRLVDLMLAETEDAERVQELATMYSMVVIKTQDGVKWDRPVLGEDGEPITHC